MLLRLRSGGGASSTPDGSAEVEARFVLSSDHTLRAFLEAATDTAGRVRTNSVVRGGSAEPLGPVPGTEDPVPFVASLLEAEGVATVSRAVVAVVRGRAFPTILSKFRARTGFWTRCFF